MIRLRTPAEMATASVRLRQAGDDHHAPLFQAAMREELRFALILPDGRFPKHLLIGDRLPLALVLCDDADVSRGPASFPQARKLLRWTRSIMLHAAGGRPEHYAAAAEATVLRGRLVVVECASGGREAEWLALIKAVAPRTPRLHITPPPGGMHPALVVPAGASIQ